MRRKFLSVLFYSLFVSIVIPGISHALNETIESGNMIDMFRASFTLAGSGDIWTKTENVGYVGSCSKGGDFGFTTKQINIKDAFADIIYVAIETQFIRVNSHNNSLGIYLYNGMVLPPAAHKSAFKKFFLQNFSLIYTVENSTASARNGEKLTHIFKFHKNDSDNIILAVKGVGVCASVYSMRVYYYYCGENFEGVRLPKTVSPLEGWKKVEANCSLNSSLSHQRTLSGFCGYDGTWNISMHGMRCFCEKGSEPNPLTKLCTPCPSGKFKPAPSNKSCQTCPDNSKSTVDRTSCKCIEGYYHSTPKAVPTTAPCFGPITEKLKMGIRELPNKTVKVTWNDAKVDDEIRSSLRYDVQCFMCDHKGRKCNMVCENARYQPRQYNMTETSVEVSNLRPGHRYIFRVYPKTVINSFIGRANWSYTETEPLTVHFRDKFADTKKPRSASKTTYFDYVVVSGIASGVLFMIMVVLLIVVVKRKSEYRRHLIIGNHQVELPYIGQKLYVDPTIYDSPEDALNEFASELDPSALVLEKLIGGGEFGDVYKGIMKCNEGKALTVAVKTLKTDHTAKNETDFLLEASVMGQFNDPNVIYLEGVITKSFPRMIITEYMSNGSLDRFLRLNDDNLTELQLIGMAKGVASGMAYLSAMNFIHRDLAARNILVNDDLLCKIADFGLSRSLGDKGSDGEYSISGGKIPVRWTAPEVIAYRKFSSSSDVWSYGILLWEIMSFGDRPYWEWDNTKVMKEVEDGFRLPPPKDCPGGVHNLMLSCWKANRSERPKFEHISQVMNGWIRSPETINEDPQESVIGDWLHSIKMGDYTSLFVSSGYESPYQLAGIGNEDLLKIGVTLIGHRNKILKAIKAFDNKQAKKKTSLPRTESIVV